MFLEYWSGKTYNRSPRCSRLLSQRSLPSSDCLCYRPETLSAVLFMTRLISSVRGIQRISCR